MVLVGRRDQGAGVTPSAGVSPPANRLAIVETALKSEQQARQRTERSLAEAHAAIRDLTTRLGHAGLTQDEAVAAVRRAETENQALAAALEAERAARHDAERALQSALAAREHSASVRRRAVTTPTTVSNPVGPPIRRRGRPPGSKNLVQKISVKEPKPVRWW